jgi:hypothetical protein
MAVRSNGMFEALTKVEICCFEWGDYVYMLVMHPN